jgi:tetratricopeptide (TPR) repeat protein
MFLGSLFNRDYRFYQEKGEKLFAQERFAEARYAFEEALQKLTNQSGPDKSIESAIRGRLAESCNRLAVMNLSEAEYALNRGDIAKAEEHLDLVNAMTTDPLVRERYQKLLDGLKPVNSMADSGEATHSCSGCSTSFASETIINHVPEYLSPQEHFELLLQTLPAGLQDRYSALGEEFAAGYVMLHSGDEEAGVLVFQNLLNKGENDILLYELALTFYRSGDFAQCESHLQRSFDINSENALCCLGMVQLLTDTGRLEESLPILHHMIEKQLLIEQALLFLGDVHLGLGNGDEAIEGYSKALGYPNVSRVAAERLILLFEKQGRREDAEHLAKRYLKGCC